MSNYEIDVQLQGEGWVESLADCEAVCVAACKAALDFMSVVEYAPDAQVSIVLGSDDAVQELNHKYRQKDKATNVLAFPSAFLDPDKLNVLAKDTDALNAPVLLGDIILAYQTVMNESSEQGKGLSEHLSHLVVHATLHLLGFDHIDDADAERMESVEIEIVSGMGIKNPYN